MKVCDNCGQAEGVHKVTEVKNTEATELHLCEKCAAQKLGQTPPESGGLLVDFLAQMGESGSTPSGGSNGSCSFCGLTFARFRETGRLGCPHCYATFEWHLRGLLRRIHTGTQHVGKVYLPPDPTASEREKRLELLRQKLQRAVDGEDFERAAELRDQIRSLEPARGAS